MVHPRRHWLAPQKGMVSRRWLLMGLVEAIPEPSLPRENGGVGRMPQKLLEGGRAEGSASQSQLRQVLGSVAQSG